MNEDRENFFVGNPASDKSVLLGLQWLASWGDTLHPGTIVVPTKDHFRRSQLATVVGDPTGRALGQGKAIPITGGRQVRGYTHRTLPRFGHLGPTLALWPGKRGLDRLHDSQASALCVVPWIDENIATWRSAVGAIDLLNPSTPTVLATTSEPVVDAALVSLTGRVNLSTGLAHPSDKTAAVGVFRILQKAGYQWTGEEISARALALGWGAKDARELGKMAQDVMEGRRFRAPGAQQAWARDILKQWRKSTGEK